MTTEQLAKNLLAIIDSEMYVNDFGGLQAGRDATTDIHAAMAKLQSSLAKPVLQDIEQYRMQMAGICAAAIGYWKDGDNIDPDYNTLALRDVAGLYQKYDVLYKVQSEMKDWEAIAADQAITIALLRLEAITQDIPQIPQTDSSNKQWVALTNEEHIQVAMKAGCMSADWLFYGAAVEQALKDKNT
jgi:hypothetical protein